MLYCGISSFRISEYALCSSQLASTGSHGFPSKIVGIGRNGAPKARDMKARGKRAARRPWFMQSAPSGLKGRNRCSITPFQGWVSLIRVPGATRCALAPGFHIPRLRRWITYRPDFLRRQCPRLDERLNGYWSKLFSWQNQLDGCGSEKTAHIMLSQCCPSCGYKSMARKHGPANFNSGDVCAHTARERNQHRRCSG